MVNLEQTDWGKEDINYFERASQLGYQMTHPEHIRWRIWVISYDSYDMTDNLRAWYKSSDQGWKYTGVHVRSCPRCAISSTKHEFVLVRVQLFKKSVFVSVHPWFKYPIKVFWNFSGERSKYISSLSRFFLCENSWSSGLFSDWPSLNPFWLAHSYLILRFFGWLNWKCYKLKNMCKNSAANNIASSKFSFSKLISKEAFQIYKINNQIEKLKSSQLKINWYLYNQQLPKVSGSKPVNNIY